MSIDVASLIESLAGVEKNLDETTLVSDHDLTVEEWAQANPDLALSVLSSEEVNALIPIAQSVAEGSKDVPFCISCTIFKFNGYKLDIIVCGAINWDENSFRLRCWFALTPPLPMPPFPKVPFPKHPFPFFPWPNVIFFPGPSLQGPIIPGAHVSCTIGYIGRVDIWARGFNDGFYVTVRVCEFHRLCYQKRFLVAKRPVTGDK
ncbi:hypothetical protein ONZ45_g8037 [Pleurotus djamor]|nr:hypothetical protein ONZ45_g8037 [Pleurotus djamor]